MISEDIQSVIEKRISEFGRTCLSKEDEKRLVEQLVENADRTFLWVSFVLKELEDSIRRSPGVIQALINKIPKSVYGLYETLLSRVPNCKDARKILNIVLGATRPLTMDEINVAFTIEPTDRTFEDLDLEPLDTLESTIKAICGLFLRVFDDRVYLVHLTAKDFLLEREGGVGPVDPNTWKNSFTSVEAHHTLAKICISYLRFDEFSNRPWTYWATSFGELRSPDQFLSWGPRGPKGLLFQNYAAKSWTIHFKHCEY